jgi:hypothetical protein
MNICILGCGPAGLLSAYACTQRGHEVRIVSKKTKSEIPGAVFLHSPVPGLTSKIPDGNIDFIKRGTRGGYAQKVYGNTFAECSWDRFPVGLWPAWSMFDLYDKLWDTFGSGIEEATINPRFTAENTNGYDLVISSIPVPCICRNSGHSFPSQPIFTIGVSANARVKDSIIYNGDPIDAWYRSSNIFGHGSTESTIGFSWSRYWRHEVKTGYKPLNTDCDCFPHIARVGRFGQWKKGVLVHHAYEQTVKLLEGLE